MSELLDRKLLATLFKEIDEELTEPIRTRILVVGGVALIFAGMQRGTQDVDSASKALPDPLVRAIRVIGQRHGLPHDRFNARAHHFAPGDLYGGERRRVFAGRNLTIVRPDLPYLLAMKLYAARLRDTDDVLWLMRHTGIRAKGALLHLVKTAYFPEEPIDAHVEHYINRVTRRLKNEPR